MGIVTLVDGQLIDEGMTTEELLNQLIILNKQTQTLLSELIEEQKITNEHLKLILT